MKRRIISLMLIFFICFCSVTDSYAAAKFFKVKTAVSYQSFKKKYKKDDKTEKNIIKKAPKVKSGRNIVTTSTASDIYFVKFTAPKTKTYRFQIKDIESLMPAYDSKHKLIGNTHAPVYGTFWIMGEDKKKAYGKRLTDKSCRTNSGSYITDFYVCNFEFEDGLPDEYYKATDPSLQYITGRYATCKLKKGETVYIATYFKRSSYKTKTFTYTLNIG